LGVKDGAADKAAPFREAIPPSGRMASFLYAVRARKRTPRMSGSRPPAAAPAPRKRPSFAALAAVQKPLSALIPSQAHGIVRALVFIL